MSAKIVKAMLLGWLQRARLRIQLKRSGKVSTSFFRLVPTIFSAESSMHAGLCMPGGEGAGGFYHARFHMAGACVYVCMRTRIYTRRPERPHARSCMHTRICMQAFT